MKTGIIGLGKMGGALLRGMLKAGAAVPEEVWVYDHHHENVQALQEEYPGVHEAASEADAADAVEVLILAVKPHGVLPLISSLSERGAELPLLISIAAAVSLDDMEACASDGTRIIRAMPNTPCMVLAGVIAYSTGNGVKDEDEEAARMLLSGCGSVYKVAESGMIAVSASSGCGPAYMFTALDALADAGVAMGLSRKTALGLAAETMRGASLMLERTGKHPMALRDEVTSPGGTTIAALNALDECGFRNAWIQAEKPLFAPERRFPLLPQLRVLQVELDLSDGLERNPDLANCGGAPFHDPVPDSFQGQGKDALVRQENAGV